MAVKPNKEEIELANREITKVDQELSTQEEETVTSDIIVDQELTRSSVSIQPQQSPPESFTIFVIGKIGAGKSSLINSLLGKDEALVSDGVHPTRHKPLERHDGVFCGVPTTFYDTRGIGDPNFDKKELIKEFKKAIKSKGDRYLIFICQEFTSRLDDATHQFLQDLAKQFKKDYNVWKKSILVLTKANLYVYFHRPATDEEKKIPKENIKRLKMLMKMQDWCENVKSSLIQYGVTEEIILRMNVCSTAIYDEEIPIYESWKETILETCIEAQQDWDINEERRRREIATRNIGAVAGGIVSVIVPVIGPIIAITLGAIIGLKLGRESFEKSMKKSEIEKYNKEAVNFEKKEKKFDFLPKEFTRSDPN
uniref:G domain-containing protein n=1 Tax=Amphimedon queenslandica TaxID=400682 RepID=A0A1X7UC58_AMPQE